MGTSPGPWRWAKSASGKEFAGSHLESANGAEIFSVDYGTPVELPEDMALIRMAPDMAAMLRELEWVEDAHDPTRVVCTRCWAWRPTDRRTHADGCRLSALLKELPK